jgi:hypothetical protein
LPRAKHERHTRRHDDDRDIDAPRDAERCPGPGTRVLSEASYRCDSCGEEIVVEIDPTAGEEQEYVEDCPVCCRPHVLHVRIGPQGEVDLDARPE